MAKAAVGVERAKRLPEWKGLRIDVKCELSAENAAAVDAFHADGSAFDRKVAALFGEREKLLAGAMDSTLRSLISDAARLNDTRRGLEDELTALRWRRFELLPRLLPEFSAEVTAAEAAYQKTIAEETARFENAGAGLDAMPAAHKHHEAAKRQLRQRVMQEVPCLAAFGRLNVARAQLEGATGQRHSVPSDRSCRIEWPGAPEGITGTVANWAGLA